MENQLNDAHYRIAELEDEKKNDRRIIQEELDKMNLKIDSIKRESSFEGFRRNLDEMNKYLVEGKSLSLKSIDDLKRDISELRQEKIGNVIDTS